MNRVGLVGRLRVLLEEPHSTGELADALQVSMLRVQGMIGYLRKRGERVETIPATLTRDARFRWPQ